MSVRIAFLSPAEAPAASGAAPAAVITVPRAAVQNGKVWIVTDGTLREQSVELGGERGEAVVVRSGLLGGEALVVNAEGELASGQRVEVASD